MFCLENDSVHCKENSIYAFPERNCAARPNFHIHVSARDLYIPTIGIGPPIFLQQNRQTDRVGIYKSLTET
jgi:hypothetical protein